MKFKLLIKKSPLRFVKGEKTKIIKNKLGGGGSFGTPSSKAEPGHKYKPRISSKS